MCENIVEFICESESIEQACLVLSASKKRNFVAVQISPAVRVSIGEYFGFYRGEDAVGKVVAALTVLGADVVVDSSIAFDAVTLMRAKALQQAKETGVALPCSRRNVPSG
jgi:iron only hydrogenase large subunit-like protein